MGSAVSSRSFSVACVRRPDRLVPTVDRLRYLDRLPRDDAANRALQFLGLLIRIARPSVDADLPKRWPAAALTGGGRRKPNLTRRSL